MIGNVLNEACWVPPFDATERWEQDFGPPVRRASSRQHSAVRAVSEELDAWAMRQQSQASQDMEGLRQEVARLTNEIAALRELLEQVQSGV